MPSPTTACKDKLHRSFRLAKLQVNRDLEAYLGEARAAAAAASTSAATGGDTSPGALTSVDRIILIAERCLGEGVASFRESIQAIVDQVEVGWGPEEWLGRARQGGLGGGCAAVQGTLARHLSKAAGLSVCVV